MDGGNVYQNGVYNESLNLGHNQNQQMQLGGGNFYHNQEERQHRRRDSDPLFSIDEDIGDGDLLMHQRKKKKDDKVPFTPEVSC